MTVMFRLLDDLLDGVGARGERAPIVEGQEKNEEASRERVRRGRWEVYPDAPEEGDGLPPILGGEMYQGTYRHPAYQNVTLKMASAPTDETGRDGSQNLSLVLEGSGSDDGYLRMSWTFRHVSGERWWVLFKEGQDYWMVESPREARFEVGVSGEVEGLWLQAEGGITDLAYFEKIA